MPDVRIAWFSPLQPVESGISLYSEDLLPLLAGSVDIDVFVDGYSPTHLRQSDALRVRRLSEFSADRYDLVVYQMGNSPAHLYMVDEVLRTPGLLVLHDAVLNHLFVQRAARAGTLDQYREEMRTRYGAGGQRAADRVLKGQAPDDLFRYPMSEPLIERSVMTLVHSEYARQQVLTWCSNSPVVRVPHGMRLPEYVERETARRELGIPLDQFVVASITHISPYKRLDVVLRALRQLRREVPARLVLAGSVSVNYPLERMVTHLGLDQVVDVLGYVTDQQARLLAAATDVIVNLRFPTAGETSGSLLHSMAAGRPVLVSETGSFAEVPRDSVVSVPVDALEENMLVAVLRTLATNDQLREEIGRRAREFISEEHSLQRWVDGYLNAIEQLTGRTLARPIVDLPEEPVLVSPSSPTERLSDPLVNEVAGAIAELGLGGDENLLHDIAESAVDLGIGLGKMGQESDVDRQRLEGPNDSL